MSSSVGMMTFPIHKIHIPNHQSNNIHIMYIYIYYIVSYTIVIIVSYTIVIIVSYTIVMFQTTNQNISHELLVANYLPAGLPSRSTSPSSNIPVESFIGLELAETIRNIEHDIAVFFSMVFSMFSHEFRRVFHVFSIWLVVYLPPLKNMSSSMGRMTSHILSHI